MPYTGPLLLIALVPLLLAVEQILKDGRPYARRRIFLMVLGSMFIWNTACIFWVFNAISAVMPSYVAILISLIPYTLGPLLISLAFLFYAQLRRSYARNGALFGLTCFWIAYEYLHQSWDLAFPWMTLGNGFAGTHQLVQWYEYTGVYGGTLWIWICNLLLFKLLDRRKTSAVSSGLSAKWLSAGFTAAVVLPIALSLATYFTYEEHENPSNVVVVQPNVDPYEKFGNLSVQSQLDQLIRLSDSVGQPNTEFFIWPESAIPERPPGVNEETVRTTDSYLNIQSFLNNYKNGNVLSGIESYQLYDEQITSSARPIDGSNQYFDVFNAAILIDQSSKVQFYHKSKLVAGVEQMPFAGLSFLKPLFAAFGGSTGSYGKQEEPTVFYAQSGIGVAPVICYESIWGNYVSEYVREGAQFITIVTNDGWWGNTSGKSQHLEYAKLRAIESRRWVARSANTGISAFINQKGDVVSKTKWWTKDALKADINLNDELTFYSTPGDYIAYAGLGGSVVFFILLIGTFFKRRFF